MLDPAILTASPPVGAWRAQPMTVAEIDAHPDADRIWATIKSMREAHEAAVEAEAEAMMAEAGEE